MYILHMLYMLYMQDGHEICFVGDEAFRELSKVVPNADDVLSKVSTQCVCVC